MSSVQRPVVIVSNRGPVTFRLSTERAEEGAEEGAAEGSSSEHSSTVLRATRGSGGLVSGLGPLLDSGEARWVAAALSEGDRVAATIANGEGNVGSSEQISIEGDIGFADRVDLVTLSDEELSAYYDVISNETLWFIHHGLFDLVRHPDFGPEWWRAWEIYEAVNERFAARVAQVAPEGAVVLVQDYHLTLVGETLKAKRPDLSVVHFLHTPFAGPDNLRVLPHRVRDQMLRALVAHDACGFHTPMWARNFLQCLDTFGVVDSNRTEVFCSTLSSDVMDILMTAESAQCQDELDRLDEQFGDIQLVVRVDRMELSKNIVRGFKAFDLLLERRSDLRGQVAFLARCYPSRENLADYRRYRHEVEQTAAAINERWGDENWQPVHLETDDNFARSVAALRRYDVLMVNPIRDGLNLVAKEGPAVNDRSGQLLLSNQAGAWTEMSDDAFEVDPFDIDSTAVALADALDMPAQERATRAGRLRRSATDRTPGDWLSDQLSALKQSEGDT